MLFAPFRPRELLLQVLAVVGTLPMPSAQCPKQARANLASRPFRGEQPQARCVNCFYTGGLRSATQVTLGGILSLHGLSFKECGVVAGALGKTSGLFSWLCRCGRWCTVFTNPSGVMAMVGVLWPVPTSVLFMYIFKAPRE